MSKDCDVSQEAFPVAKKHCVYVCASKEKTLQILH